MKKLYKFIIKKKVQILVALLGLTPIVWFWGRYGQIINGIDTNFPLNPLTWLQKRFYVWNDDLNGGIDFSSSLAGIFFHSIQVAPYILGSSLPNVQIISLIFWFMLIAFSAYFYISVLIKNNRLAQLVFVVLYCFNIYLFNAWENVKVANLSLVAAIPLFLGIYVRLINSELRLSKALLLNILVGLVVSGTGINPAYLITFFLVTFIYSLIESFSKNRTLKFAKSIKYYFILSLVILFLNAYWALPTTYSIISNIDPSKSIDQAGYTNWVYSLSENTSLLNILRIQGAWDWYAVDDSTGTPLYIPYALNYFHNPIFILFSFFITLLSIISLIYRNKNKDSTYLAFGSLLLLGVFFGAGTHEPTGNLFNLLSDIVPFFSLFRSPWYIFTPLVTLSFSGLISLLAEKLLTDKKINDFGLKYVVNILVLLFIIGNLFYAYPLVSGKIFRPYREDGFFINFPDYVLNAGSYLQNNDSFDRILTYPDEEIEKFDWKYRGVESILQLITNREFLYPPLNNSNSSVAIILKELYTNLKEGRITSAERLASKLYVNTLFEKKDQSTLSPELPVSITKNPIYAVGEWVFYKFPSTNQNMKIFSSQDISFGTSNVIENAKILSIANPEEVIVNPMDTEVKKISNIDNFSGSKYIALNNQLQDFEKFNKTESNLKSRLIKRDLNKVKFDVYFNDSGFYSPILEKYKLEEFSIDESTPLNVMVNGDVKVWEIDYVDDSFVYYKDQSFDEGHVLVEININNRNLVKGGDFLGVPTYRKSDQGEFQVLGESDHQQYLSILNNADIDTSAIFPIEDFDYMEKYLIQMKYRQIYGDLPNILISQQNDKSPIKMQLERMPQYPEWNYFGFYYQPVMTPSNMEVALIAPKTKDPLGTKILYGDLQVFRVFANNLFFEKSSNIGSLSKVDVKLNKISPTQYEGFVSKADLPHILVFSENYSPMWKLDIKGVNNFPANLTHFSANLFANAWYIEDSPQEYEFVITYQPQKLFYLGVIISILTFVGIISVVIYSKNKRNGIYD